MTSFAELATPSITDERTLRMDNLLHLIHKDAMLSYAICNDDVVLM